MRVISVKQPWAGLLMAGEKRFEVRGWRPVDDRGLVLVHASSGTAPLSGVEDEPLFHEALRRAGMQDKRAWARGNILGVVEIRRVQTPPPRPSPFKKKDELLSGDIDGQALWEVGKRWQFAAPIPCHGKLNLWKPDPALRRNIAGQLRRCSLSSLPWLERYTRTF